MRFSIAFAAPLLLLVACGTAPAAQAPRGGQAVAVFAGGCFWCTEADFDKVPGVTSTTSGYIGGKVARPSYEQVSAGGTGHIEAVRVVFDPKRVSYSALADHFFRTVDPLDAGGQFCDRGYQYRTALFVTPEQRATALAATRKASATLKKPLATLILPARQFYPAEDYHQDYYKKNPIRYRFYRASCGRDARLKQVWGAKG